MKSELIKYVLAAAILLFNVSVKAEDIDLFIGAEPSPTNIPNVLFVVDNTANWNTAFTNEMAALASVFEALPKDKFNIGLMMFTETGGGNAGNDGAYVRAAVRLMNEANKTKYKALVTSLDQLDDKSNGGKIGKAMEEAYLYFKNANNKAGVPHSGNQKAKTDYLGNTTGTVASKAIYALPGNALSSKAATVYNSPVVAGCAKNYIIYISNGPAQDNNSDIKQATDALKVEGGTSAASTISISPSGSQDNVADEWARFMRSSNQAITTYTIDVNKGLTGQGPGWTALLKSMAAQSDGTYFDVSSTGSQIADALNKALSQIQAVDSVFASVSLPVSSSVQGKFLNQVYIGMFRPDAAAKPRWYGNLKQYKIGEDNGDLELQDAGGNAATDPIKDKIASCARSFWTPSALDSYWAFQSRGSCETANSGISNSPDGEVVEKGGQAFKLRAITPTTRNMKTCDSSTCANLIDFTNVGNKVTPQMLGLTSSETTLRDSLVNWQRGQDLQDEDKDTNTTEMRPSAHGDLLNSRPLAVNYGTSTTPEVVVYYGGNDGALHAVNGNRDASIGSATAGSELWSFVPAEFMPKIKRIYDNTVNISFPNTTDATAKPKDYGVDGLVTEYRDAGNTWIFSTLRRGGRAMYAFDVSSPTSPTLKWRVGCTDSNICTSGYSGLGQTWSPPTVMKAAGYGAGTSPMLIMGGGYDTCHDSDPNTSCNASSKGRYIYVIDANTGGVLQTFTTDSSVVGGVNTINDKSGLVKYAYAADLAGNVYRISGASANTEIGTTAPGSWTMTKIASLGGGGADNRKFMFTPDILDAGNSYIVLLGSGDREKPLQFYSAAAAVKNRFYMFRDKPSDVNWLKTEASNCDTKEIICNESLFAITTNDTPTPEQLAGKKGWYFALATNEQVVTSSATAFNIVYFSTHTPTSASGTECTTLGTAKRYNLNYTNAASAGDNPNVRGEVIVGGGLPASPVIGVVTLDDGKETTFCFGCGKSDLIPDPPKPPTSAARPKSRVYWKIVK